MAGSEREEKMFAVIKTGGKQYRVAADDLIEVDKIAGAAGEAVAFAEVLVVGGEETLLGSPTVAGASVRGEVVEQGRKPKLIAFKKRRRKNSRRKRGHRQEFTRVRITEILTGSSRDQAKTAKPRAEPAEPAEPAEKAAARKPKAEPAESVETTAAPKPKAESAEATAKAAPSSEKESGEPATGSTAAKSRAETKTRRGAPPADENAAGEDKSK
jgi:large subunit ribosomal protein L21